MRAEGERGGCQLFHLCQKNAFLEDSGKQDNHSYSLTETFYHINICIYTLQFKSLGSVRVF